MSEYKLVLGLEIHIHVKTETGMFCRCKADIYGAEPNTHVCPVCLGLPGALPIPNLEAIKATQKLGIALNSTLNKESMFERKHYFYPDLPKGYQISQYKQPLCVGGYLDLKSGKRVEINRIHIEEDTAKSFHENGKTLIDYNMSGAPLMELVTEPCFETVEEAVEFCKQIQNIVRFLEISDADMEKAQMRLEPNISMRTIEMQQSNELPKYKVEVKNINSFRFMEKAVKAEMERQSELLSKGETPLQENRGYIEATGKTVSQRSKEEAHDYRYFPEPDIPPMIFDDIYFAELKSDMKELPTQIAKRLIDTYKVSANSAEMLVEAYGKEMVTKFEAIVSKGIDATKAVNTLLNKKDFQTLTVEEFISKLSQESDKVSDEDILVPVVQKVISENSKAVTDYKSGNLNSLQFLIGMVMRETKGKADANTIKELLLKQLT